MAILWSFVGNASVAFVTLCMTLWSLPDVSAALDSPTGFSLIYALQQAGPRWAQAITAIVVLIAFAGCTGCNAAASREMAAFARDKGLPGSTWLAKVSVAHHCKLAYTLTRMLLDRQVHPSASQRCLCHLLHHLCTDMHQLWLNHCLYVEAVKSMLGQALATVSIALLSLSSILHEVEFRESRVDWCQSPTRGSLHVLLPDHQEQRANMNRQSTQSSPASSLRSTSRTLSRMLALSGLDESANSHSIRDGPSEKWARSQTL